MSLLIAADKPQKDFGENVEVRNTKGDDSKPVIVVENLLPDVMFSPLLKDCLARC